MIPYIEVRDRYTRLAKEILKPSDCFFELKYYGVGEFKIVCPLVAINKGDFVSIPNKKYLWIITSINPKYDVKTGYTMTIQGKQAKYILNDRIIETNELLSNDLATAINHVVRINAGVQATTERSMGIGAILNRNVSETIEDTQATRGNLFEFTEALLKTKECGADLYLNNNNIMTYETYKGVDKSDSVVFSQSMDNLLSDDYIEENLNEKNYILVESEDVLQHYSLGSLTGLDRKEIYFESNVSPKYTDQYGNEVELNLQNATDLATFKRLLEQAGNEELTKHVEDKNFNGVIDTTYNQYEFGVDYGLGDIVAIKEEYLNIEITPRVTKITLAQSAKNGYSEQIETGEE